MTEPTDKEIADAHRSVAANLGMSPAAVFELLAIAGKYANTLQADNEMLPQIMQAYTDICALQAKYKPLIDRFNGNLPQNTKLISEALPIVQGA